MESDFLPIELSTKRDRLLVILRSMDRVTVAFSGGVDSTVVAQAAFFALGDRAVAATADSPSVPRTEIAEAQQLAERIGISHVLVKTDEFDNPDYTKNDGSRCYFCKDELYTRIAESTDEVIVSGANLDDQGDYRPGLKAAAEHRVRHPLQEAGFTKQDVRTLARHWNLPVWDKPASPCLSSRLAPGVAVTAERTGRIEQAEAYLKSLGIRDCRVRLHEGDLARIEVPLEDLVRLAVPEIRKELAQRFRSLGFAYVTLDLEGLRSGNLNALISLETRNRFGNTP